MSTIAVLEAVQKGDVQSLRTLLEKDPSGSTARDANGVSAIMHSLYSRRTEMLELLLSRNPMLDIYEAVGVGDLVQVSKLLQEKPELTTQFSPDGFTPLHLACFFGNEEIVDLLLEKGVDASLISNNGMKVQPLHSAATARNTAIVKKLLEHNAPVDAQQNGGWTAFHSAALHGITDMVEVLLAHGADRNLPSDDGTTAAQMAAKGNHDQLVKLLSP
jgi:uncharacterized protein